MIYERKSDCPPVESFIWGCVGKDYGEFSGIKGLTYTELVELERIVKMQIVKMIIDSDSHPKYLEGKKK